MVALTGIEGANCQFSSVQLGLTDSKYVQFVRHEMRKVRHEGLACQRGASATAQINFGGPVGVFVTRS